MSLSLSLCAPGTCEEKARVKACVLKPTKKQREFEFEGEDISLIHTQKNRVSLSLSVRIFCSFTLKKQRECGFECEEKAKVKRSYSNSHSLWPLCPELDSNQHTREGAAT